MTCDLCGKKRAGLKFCELCGIDYGPECKMIHDAQHEFVAEVQDAPRETFTMISEYEPDEYPERESADGGKVT